MKKKWILELGLFLISRVELCNFPIWYDKGIIDLVTLILIPTFCCIEGSKNGFLLPAFHVFLLVSMSPPLLSLQIINGQMLIFAHLLSKTRAGTPFDTDLERGAWSQKKFTEWKTPPDNFPVKKESLPKLKNYLKLYQRVNLFLYTKLYIISSVFLWFHLSFFFFLQVCWKPMNGWDFSSSNLKRGNWLRKMGLQKLIHFLAKADKSPFICKLSN